MLNAAVEAELTHFLYEREIESILQTEKGKNDKILSSMRCTEKMN